MKNLVLAIFVAVALAVGYWLISPLFIDKEVNEDLSPEIEAAVEQAIEEFKEDQGDKAMMEKSLRDQLGDEAMMEKFMTEMKEMEDKEMVEAMPETSSAPQILKVGSIQDVAHHGSGAAKIIDLGGDQGKIVRLQDLDVSNGPDLRVLLSKSSVVRSSADLGDYVELGKLKGNKGTQNYIVPSNVDVSEYSSVVVYCKPFKVVFNYAGLE